MLNKIYKQFIIIAALLLSSISFAQHYRVISELPPETLNSRPKLVREEQYNLSSLHQICRKTPPLLEPFITLEVSVSDQSENVFAVGRLDDKECHVSAIGFWLGHHYGFSHYKSPHKYLSELLPPLEDTFEVDQMRIINSLFSHCTPKTQPVVGSLLDGDLTDPIVVNDKLGNLYTLGWSMYKGRKQYRLSDLGIFFYNKLMK